MGLARMFIVIFSGRKDLWLLFKKVFSVYLFCNFPTVNIHCLCDKRK